MNLVLTTLARHVDHFGAALDAGSESGVLSKLPTGNTRRFSFYPDYREYRNQADLLSGVIAFEDRPLTLGDEREPKWICSEMVSGNFFRCAGS
jgi:hypothetical protein